ncbi:MAG TPA: VOC family protein [Thermoanaerobaculia bacterium]|nr:VOC family protein [Thermoanaerobaculia bacterium]
MQKITNHLWYDKEAREAGAMASLKPKPCAWALSMTMNSCPSIVNGPCLSVPSAFTVHCETQQEIDDYWDQLSADPKAEQCGWLKDRVGLSWQIVPTAMNRMMAQGSQEQIRRVTQAFLQMKKFDIAKLEEAYAGR